MLFGDRCHSINLHWSAFTTQDLVENELLA